MNISKVISISCLLGLMTFCISNSNAQNLFPGNGNVGIGTTTPNVWFNPSPYLHITGGRPTISLTPNASGGLATIQFRGITNNPISTSGNTNGSEIHINFQDGSPSLLGFGSYQFAGGGTNIFAIRGNGNIGIATSAPSQRLDVIGNIVSDGFALSRNNTNRGAIWFGNVGDVNHRLYNNSGNLDGQGAFDGCTTNFRFE